jgi:hypothetical protein
LLITVFRAGDHAKKASLQEECTKRGLATEGKRQELVDRLKEYTQRYHLGDENFTAPRYRTVQATGPEEEESLLPLQALPSCYPEAYEGFLGIVELRQKNMLMSAPPE